MEGMIWTGKRVYIQLKNSGRCYSGLVLNEDSDSITIRDIKQHIVRITFETIALLQEEGVIK